MERKNRYESQDLLNQLDKKQLVSFENLRRRQKLETLELTRSFRKIEWLLTEI